MIRMTESNLNLEICKKDLSEFDKLLSDNLELEEKTLYDFFVNHPNLISLIGSMISNVSAKGYQNQFNIFNEFYADFAVANRANTKFVFIEFESAKKESIFREIINDKSVRHEWSPRFEHGFSQLVDWFYRLDDYRATKKIQEHFGVQEFNYIGMLVIGRSEFIKNPGLKNRLKWRNDKILIDNNKIICYTFDELLEELTEKFAILLELKNL